MKVELTFYRENKKLKGYLITMYAYISINLMDMLTLKVPCYLICVFMLTYLLNMLTAFLYMTLQHSTA